MLNFRKLTWQDKDNYTGYFQSSPVHYAEYSFVCLWSWQHSYPLEIAQSDSPICWLRSNGPFPGIFGPSGNWDAVTDWDRELSNFNAGDVIYDVPAKVMELLSTRKNLRFTEDRDQHEYVYSVKDLIALKGKAFAHKRNRVRAFLDGYEWDYYPITPADLEGSQNAHDESGRSSIAFRRGHCDSNGLQELGGVRVNGRNAEG